MDHYLGLLAASLGELSAAAAHLAAAAAQHHQLGATAWARLSAQEQARLRQATLAAAAANRFQRDGAVWHITYDGKTIRMPDAKGLRDIATLLARPREPVPSTEDIHDATAGNDPERAARAAAERDSLISELTRALGLGGRSRRLGDDTERARKAVTARIGHAVDRLQHYHPGLAAHLRATIRTGTACAYQPAQPIDWNLLFPRQPQRAGPALAWR